MLLTVSWRSSSKAVVLLTGLPLVTSPVYFAPVPSSTMLVEALSVTEGVAVKAATKEKLSEPSYTESDSLTILTRT